jgi:hypothetical protein
VERVVSKSCLQGGAVSKTPPQVRLYKCALAHLVELYSWRSTRERGKQAPRQLGTRQIGNYRDEGTRGGDSLAARIEMRALLRVARACLRRAGPALCVWRERERRSEREREKESEREGEQASEQASERE